MNDKLKNGEYAYIPNTGIYRWNDAEDKYDKVCGKDIPPSTGVIHPILLNDKILEAAGFKLSPRGFEKGDIVIDINLQEPKYTVGGTPIKDFNDLYGYMEKKGIPVDWNNLLEAFSSSKKREN